MKKILFLSYDGMTDPLGQSQVIPYMRGLSQYGYQFTILSFEKKERFKKNGKNIQALLEEAGIKWEPCIFSKWPPVLSKLYDAWKMKQKAFLLHKRDSFSLIHCRSYVAAEVGLALHMKFKIPFLFDMRGFWVDERVDNGQWNLRKPFFRFIYKRYKKKEKELLKYSSHIISLTEKGKEELEKSYGITSKKITIIPCCVDMEHFDYNKISKDDIVDRKKQLNINTGEKILTYLGSLGGWYLLNEMLQFFLAIKAKIPELKFLFITYDPESVVIEAAEKLGIKAADIIVRPASRNEVPLYLSLSNWSIFFIKDSYSKKASSPTKQGEIMSMGIPLICNDVGDTGKIIEASMAGMIVNSFNSAEYNRVADNAPGLLELDMAYIRNSARQYFDLAKGVNEYLLVYKKLV